MSKLKSEILKKNLKLIILVLVMFFLFSVSSYAGQKWNRLDYDVTLNSDGSMNVVETWDVDISNTNTMFKTFEDTSYDNYFFENVKVSEVYSGQEYFLNQIYEQQYHVDDGCYYGLTKSPSEFEIAWNVGLDNSSARRTYRIYYTVENVITRYTDCSEFYWQFLSKNNTMTGENVTGRIRLPSNVSNLEKLRVWGHGSLSAEVHKTNSSLVEFTVPYVRANEMIELRVVVEENLFPSSTIIDSDNRLYEILKEEHEWADEANRKREEAQSVWKKIFVGIIVWILANIFIIFLFVKKTQNYKAIREQLMVDYGDFDADFFNVEYFREIPNEENATPGRAVYLKNFRKNSSDISNDLSNIFSATILNLSLKKILYFEAVSEKEIRIYLTEDYSTYEQNLLDDEQTILRLLKRALRGKEYITTRDFNRFASREYDFFYDQMNSIDKDVEERLINDGTIDGERKERLSKWSSKAAMCFVLAFFMFFIMPFIVLMPGVFIGLIVLGISARKTALCVSILNYGGQAEVNMWNGLMNFMKDYSLLNERLVPDIVIWEKYLVYATAFGIADKVLKQLKVVHPEMFNRYDDYSGRRYGYWNMVSSPNFYNDNFFNSFSRDLERVCDNAISSYSAAHSSSSSGSGGGGGFSSGGGGGGGGGSCGGR